MVGAVSEIEVVDSTWIGTPASRVAAAVAEPANWPRWWPELVVRVVEPRGEKGVRWAVGPSERGTVAGSMEVWLEPQLDGVLAHFLLRLDGTDSHPLGRRRVRRLSEKYRVRAKDVFWGLGNQLDPGRLARISGRCQVASCE